MVMELAPYGTLGDWIRHDEPGKWQLDLLTTANVLLQFAEGMMRLPKGAKLSTGTLCVVGGVLGILLGIGGAAAVAAIVGWPIFIGPEVIVLAAGFAAIIGIFFGFYPALKASRLDPIEALRFE